MEAARERFERGQLPFGRGQAYTRAEIHAVLGGSRRAALPMKEGRVVCACLTRERNPRAPDEIVIGAGERAAQSARWLAASRAAVPVFVRQRAGGWEYQGERRVRALVDEPGALLALVAEGAPADAALALLLEEVPARELPATVPAGQGTGSPTAALPDGRA